MRVLTALVFTLLTVSASGCADMAPSAQARSTDSPVPASPPADDLPSPFKGLPDGVQGTLESPAGVVVPDEPGTLWVVTYGSGSNPQLPREVTADGQVITVVLANDEGRPSTMDYVPTTSTIAIPEGVDAAQPIVAVLGDLGHVGVDLSTPGTVSWVPARG